jgi:hypothetical protein
MPDLGQVLRDAEVLKGNVEKLFDRHQACVREMKELLSERKKWEKPLPPLGEEEDPDDYRRKHTADPSPEFLESMTRQGAILAKPKENLQEATDLLRRAHPVLMAAEFVLPPQGKNVHQEFLSALDQLPSRDDEQTEYTRRVLVEIRAALIKVIELGCATGRAESKRTKREAEAVRQTKILIKQIYSELKGEGSVKDIHRKIAERLHDHPRPPGAKWANLPWDAAITHPKWRGPVRAWISKAIHEA